MKIKTLKRLIADEGKVLKNLETGIKGYCVDTLEENVDKWEEIEDTENKSDKLEE